MARSFYISSQKGGESSAPVRYRVGPLPTLRRTESSAVDVVLLTIRHMLCSSCTLRFRAMMLTPMQVACHWHGKVVIEESVA